ncbi:hypothetical protein [Winogradskyella sp.]|uniref:hypothetical protein n=1 Tax=Winogradskyella sp. TaxID=1883156 RepID=UPI0035178ACA
MRPTFLYLLLFLGIFLSETLNSQILNDITKPALSRNSLAEKIYLQIDNTLYQTGETIWYKAIVTKSYDNSLSDLSQVLHVELIDNSQNIIESQLLKLNDGVANGSFNLEKSYDSGKYLIRAYTKWNRNFDEDFMYSQAIEIFNLKKENEEQKAIINVVVGTGDYKTIQADINPRVVNSNFKGKLKFFIDTGNKLDSLLLEETSDNVYKLDYTLQEDAIKAELKFSVASKNRLKIEKEEFYKEIIIIDKDHVDLQFFPEGGKLVNGLLSTVGFKVLDYNGLGFKIEGVIKDSKGVEVTSFGSNNLGMGTFKLQPKQGVSYHALIENDGMTYRYDLPYANSNGSVLTLVNLQNELRLSVESQNLISKYITVEVSSRGVKYQSFKFKNKDKITTVIPKHSLPDGIVKIVVRNDKNQKLCERLFFNDREDQRLSLSLSSDRTNYSQREKVRLQIGLDSTPIVDNTSLSVLVMNEKRIEASKSYKTNILTYLLLNSELKGFIEQPDYYFKKSNRSRLLDLDALMLTQGWRDYNYEKVAPMTTYIHQPETHLELSGTIGEYFNPKKKPKNPLDLNLIIHDDTPHVYSMEIPENGKYHFQLDDIYNSDTEFFMQVVNKKGKPIDFGINLDKKWKPEVKIEYQQSFLLPTKVTTTFTEQMETVNEIQKKYESTFSTIALDEVTVKGYKMTPEREKFIELHGEPDVVIDGKKLNENAPDWSHGVFSVLKAQYSDDIQVLYTEDIPPFLYAWDRRYDMTYVLVDNIPVYIDDYSAIQDIPTDEVESIDIIRDPKDKHRYCTQVFVNIGLCPPRVVLVNIYTKSGRGLFGISKAEGVLINNIKGFTESVKFYAPNYETLSNQDWTIPDNRSVIHWEPNITLNDKGEHTLEFYSDDYIGNVIVIVEAISKYGKIGYVEKTYVVKEAER